MQSCCSSSNRVHPNQARIEHTASLLKAIGHPVRLQILHHLARENKSVCVCDIEPHLGIKQPTVSHHLKILREAELVEFEQRGLFAYYRILPGTLSHLTRCLEELKPAVVSPT
jgi:ArsR family transcriptional regulator, arsenate/arsenite/antimonite-responsive transcriptional repressor